MDEQTEELIHVAIEWADASTLQVARVVEAANQRTRRTVEHIETGTPADDVQDFRTKFTADRHFLLIALNQLCKTLGMLRSRGLPDVPNIDLCSDIQLHRDIFEHWESHAPGWYDASQNRHRAGRRFADAYPDRYPWADSFGTSGRVRIGELEIHSLSPVLEDARSRLQALLGDR